MNAPEIIIVHSDTAALMRLTHALAAMRYNVTAAPASRAIDTARRVARRAPDAVVVGLDGDENIAELRALMSASSRTRFVLLLPSMPPRAALSRAVGAHGSAVLARDAAPVVVGATLVALLAGSAATPGVS
jgi:DNA-binding NarL/FixJ family response regulator